MIALLYFHLTSVGTSYDQSGSHDQSGSDSASDAYAPAQGKQQSLWLSRPA